MTLLAARIHCKLLAILFFQVLPVFTYALSCKETFSISVEAKPLQKFESVFGTRNPIIGMVHLAGKSNKEVISRALEEMAVFEKTGVHAAIIENYHGSLAQVEMVLRASQNRFPRLVLGVNVLPNEYDLAFYLSRRYGAKFIQLDYVSGKYDDKEFPTTLDARNYYRYRRAYPEILVLGGVHPKYYSPIEGSNLKRDLRTAQRRADAIVVTGSGTGMETPFEKIKFFREYLGENYPLVIGAGLTAENAREQLNTGNGAIVGSYFKDGNTKAPIIENRIYEILSLLPKSVEVTHD